MSQPLLVAMAGFPGTGKSTLAARLAGALGGVVLSKDVARAALFPAPFIDYSAAQDHVAMSAVFSAAEHFLKTRPAVPVFLDGRTFCKRGQIDSPQAIAILTRARLCVVECVCSDEVAHARLTADLAAGSAPRGQPHAGPVRPREGRSGAAHRAATHPRHRHARARRVRRKGAGVSWSVVTRFSGSGAADPLKRVTTNKGPAPPTR